MAFSNNMREKTEPPNEILHFNSTIPEPGLIAAHLFCSFNVWVCTAAISLNNSAIGLLASSETKGIRSAIKMQTFLMSWLVCEAVREHSAKAAKTAATKKQASANQGPWNWEKLVEKSLGVLIQTVELNLPLLWSTTKVEEEFFNLFVKAAVAVLENPYHCKCVLLILINTFSFQMFRIVVRFNLSNNNNLFYLYLINFFD
jgi:hypothetical protein